jgi:tripartite-type tricarboxylate transporter receptor subunit TctC
MKKILLIILILSALTLGNSFIVFGADYPTKPIKLIVPWATGGITTFMAHALADHLKPILKEAVLVHNMPGAQGTVGVNTVVTSKPDGYTLGSVPIGPIVTQPIFEKTPYTHLDLEPVCQYSYLPLFFIAGAHTPYKNVQEFIEFAKKNPDKVIFHHPGDRTVPYFSVKSFATVHGIKMVKAVPYPGMGKAVIDTIGGHVDVGPASIGEIVPYMEGDKIRLLVFFAKKRWEEFPDVPSSEELGVKALPKIWNGIFAPKGTPKEVLDLLERTIREAVFSKGFQEAMKKLKQPIEFLGREEFRKIIEEDVKYFKRMKEEAK